MLSAQFIRRQSPEPVLVVTGANSGIGFGLVERLLEHHAGRKVTIVMACRSIAKATEARQRLVQSYFPKSQQEEGFKMLQIVSVDLSHSKSVFKFCAEILLKFKRLDCLFLNAGLMPVEGMSLNGALKDLVLRPATLAKTGGSALLQSQGMVTAEGLGTVFAANVFGHYVMVRELEQLLSQSGDARVIWFSSTSAEPQMFQLSDWQGLKSLNPYESSKRLCELICFATHDRLAKKRIHSFVVSPGVVNSNIAGGFIHSVILFIILVFLRLMGISGINISPKNGASSALFIAFIDNPLGLDHTKVYHSEINRFGRRSVVPLTVHRETDAVYTSLVDAFDYLYRKLRDIAYEEDIIN